jgi:peptidoglycan glycosyltransferase
VRRLGRFLTQENADRLASMMRGVVIQGTARGIDLPQLRAAGKTGTAENQAGASHSWFVGFAPHDNPALAVSVLIEHAGLGSRAALPLARSLLLSAANAGYLEETP